MQKKNGASVAFRLPPSFGILLRSFFQGSCGDTGPVPCREGRIRHVSLVQSVCVDFFYGVSHARAVRGHLRARGQRRNLGGTPRRPPDPSPRVGHGMTECVVCYHSSENRILPCNHIVCARCAERWFAKSCTCPFCRECPASLTHPTSVNPFVHCGRCVVIDTFDDLGLTIVDHASKGVRVARVLHGESAHRNGLRTGDVITHVNGIKAHSHAQTMAVLEQAVKHRVVMTFRVVSARPSAMRRFVSAFAECVGSRPPRPSSDVSSGVLT